MANKFKKIEIDPDMKYGSVLVAKFINTIMKEGKKSVAQKVVYDSFEIVKSKTKGDPVEIFEKAIAEISPKVEVRPQRVGGATYQVPREVKEKRALSLAMRWLISASKTKKGKPMAEKLAEELVLSSKGEGEALRKRDSVHKMAQANKAFAYLAR